MRWWGTGRQQAKRRKSYNVRDQFGRQYLVVIEIETGDAVQVTPTFTDRDNTPPRFIKLDPSNPKACLVDFDGWAQQQQQALLEYDEHRHRVGQALYEEKYDEGKPATPRMMKLLGLPPMAPEDVRAIERRLTAEAAQLRSQPAEGRPVAPAARPTAQEVADDIEDEQPDKRPVRPGKRRGGNLVVGVE